MAPSAAGQAASLGAMLLPVVFAKTNELQFLVIVSAIASFSSYVGVWSLPNIYASLVEDAEADVGMLSSLSVLLVLFTAGLLAAVLSREASEYYSDISLWASWMTLVQGAYLAITAAAIRDKRYDNIAVARLVLGFLSLALTLIACLFSTAQESLVVALVVSFGISSGLMFWRDWRDWKDLVRRGWAQPAALWIDYLRRHAATNAAALIAGVAFHITNISIAKMGSLAGSWAIVARLCGGFSTTAQQIVAPLYEIRFTTAIREMRYENAARVQRVAMIAGTGLGLLAAMVAVAAVMYAGEFWILTSREQLAVLAGVPVFMLSLLSTSMIARNVTLAGGRKEYLIWATVKAVLGLGAFYMLSGLALLIAIIAVEALFQALYAALAFLRLRLGRLSAR